MFTVFIVPTGIGCEIGGHAGDATPALKLIAACCDKVVTHPNVVNASDINEMPANALYVEGSMLDRFLRGEVNLKEVRSNKIICVTNAPAMIETINAVSAARATLGANIEIVELKEPLRMVGQFAEDGVATGYSVGIPSLIEQVKDYDMDALAIATPIEVPEDVAVLYLRRGGVNPWGGIEAIVSKQVSKSLNIPVAHAPVEFRRMQFNEIVDPREAAEVVSVAYLHCVLKGLHKAPRIGGLMNVSCVDAMVSPYGCYGIPHMACYDRGIPVIHVRENRCVLNRPPSKNAIVVESYLEAAGVLMCIKAGTTLESVQRPLAYTKVHGS